MTDIFTAPTDEPEETMLLELARAVFADRQSRQTGNSPWATMVLWKGARDTGWDLVDRRAVTVTLTKLLEFGWIDPYPDLKARLQQVLDEA